MDVRKIESLGLNKVAKKQDSITEKVSFTEFMATKRGEMVNEKFVKMIKEIEVQGKNLSENRTVDQLRKYKKLVKEFMEEAVQHGLSLEERRGFNRRGRTKVYKIVEQVDKKLLDLTDAVLKQQQSSLQILNQVGEIQGLLINIYT